MKKPVAFGGDRADNSQSRGQIEIPDSFLDPKEKYKDAYAAESLDSRRSRQ
jgi:hypothetical protein